MTTATLENPTTTTSLEPLGDRVVLRPLEREQKTPGGLFIPDTAKDKPQQGEVLAVGPGRLLDSGELHPPAVEPGQRVLFAMYAGTEIKIGDQELLIVREQDILARVNTAAPLAPEALDQ